MVFQDPFSSLDPRQTVMQLISEPIIEHKLLKSRSDIEERTLELMRTVGLAERYMNVYPRMSWTAAAASVSVLPARWL